MESGIATLVIGLVLLFVFIAGGIQTFQRNWILALLMLIFLAPIWVCWAIVEIFLPKPVKQPTEVIIRKED